MDSNFREMALQRYGYGHWDAPYWFIGPEEGKAREEDIQRRLDAWLNCGKPEVCDCRDFHTGIGVTKWHLPPPPLQPTWRRLMLLLMAFLGESTGNDHLRAYQRHAWGMIGGETCVVELSGLPAYSYEESKKQKRRLFDKKEIEEIRKKRIDAIRVKIKKCAPKLVVLYGCSERKHWEEIATHEFPPCIDGSGIGHVWSTESTTFAFTKHPVAHGPTDYDWKNFGKSLQSYRA